MLHIDNDLTDLTYFLYSSTRPITSVDVILTSVMHFKFLNFQIVTHNSQTTQSKWWKKLQSISALKLPKRDNSKIIKYTVKISLI